MKTLRQWWIYPLVAIALIFGTMGIAQAAGFWVSSGRQAIVPGQPLAPADLKGWMTIQQAADGLGMPAAELIAIMAPPPGVSLTPDMAFKDVEAVWPEFELSALRDRLAGKPAPSASAGTPTAVGPSAAAPSPGPRSGSPAGTPRSGASAGSGAGAGSGDGAITGQKTLKQVADSLGVPVERLIAEAGLPADVNPNATLKSLVDTIPGFEVQQVRDAADRLR